MANMRLSSRVRAGARALTTPTRDLHLLEHDDHEEVIMNNHPSPVLSADLGDSTFSTRTRVHTQPHTHTHKDVSYHANWVVCVGAGLHAYIHI